MPRPVRLRSLFELDRLEIRRMPSSAVVSGLPDSSADRAGAHHPFGLWKGAKSSGEFRLNLRPRDILIEPDTSNPPRTAITPAEFSQAYGIDQLPQQGQGVTIAIVDPLDDPKIASDLATFSTAYGLPQMDGLNGDPTFTKATPQGQPRASILTAPEIALDVEWAHAVAPRANIVLVESLTESKASLYASPRSAEVYATSQPGVVVASNSWAFVEYPGEVNDDASFSTPSGHSPVAVTFATGDTGEPGFYPAFSPDVIAIGGTTLFTNPDGSYKTETGWSGSGGGLSRFESSPSFQAGLDLSNRSIPDVSIDANPLSGVAIYDTFGLPGWVQVGGTSQAAPAWAGLIALAQEARIEKGLTPLDSVQINERFYAAYASPAYSQDFHDIVKGNNGSAAGPGYDEVTGLGSPKAPEVVRLLAP